ncbi:hypothetical protein HOLleu_22342 [Holothuria leucospilota]|uniref:Uncharacterized protein n=1 Tax=Holothuria leucospilota TaxID=206669 RepID=A0A9Q1BYX4_HOLLE|nr:hypothetical protein HOLleu_22342 [Holothuria leucospilota]
MYVDRPSASDVSHFPSTVENVGFYQHESGPTHIHGHTLDLVLSHQEDNLIVKCSVDSLLSDHYVISFCMQCPTPVTHKIKIMSRKLNSVNKMEYQSDLSASFRFAALGVDVNDLTVFYNGVTRSILDSHAPVKASTADFGNGTHSHGRQSWGDGGTSPPTFRWVGDTTSNAPHICVKE